jgi:hypothetical protein
VNPLSRREGKRYTDSTLNKLWSAACKKYDIIISLYNGLKHSTLDYYYNDLGVPLTDLMDLTGHKNLDCIKHYARMKIKRQKSLLALEKDAPHLKLIEGGKEVNSHKIVTKRKIDDLKTILYQYVTEYLHDFDSHALPPFIMLFQLLIFIIWSPKLPQSR